MKQKPPRDVWAVINGTDLSRFVQSVDTTDVSATVVGRQVGDIILAGFFDDAQPNCAVCGEQYTPGPEGRGYLTVTELSTGRRTRIGPVCHACGTAVIAPQ